MNTNTSGRRRMLRTQGDIPADTIILASNSRILLQKETLLRISNVISNILKRKMGVGEVDSLTKYISRLPESNFYEMAYGQAVAKIAKDFIARHITELGTLQEQDFDERLSGVDRDTDSGTISDYEKKEIFQFTPSENAYKFSAHQDRRGNAIIDRDRVEGARSSPDNILPTSSVKNQYMVNVELYKSMKLLQSFLAPESTEEMFSKIQSINTNFFNINLVHQTIQFDSRNRLPTNSNTLTEYRWNIHAAGLPGQLGSIRILDTVQQIIQMRICPFWIPINPSTANPYAKIRLLFREFITQSITVSEFNDALQSTPTLENYHFEFEVEQTIGDRMYLVPCQKTYTFRKPIPLLETLTTQFRTPYGELVFDPDSGIFTVTYGLPTLFTITNPAAHLLNTGDLIYVYNVASGSAAVDTEINRAAGHIITVLNPTQFTIAFDSSAAVGADTGIHVYYGSKRVFFQVEFLCLEQ